MGNKPSNVYGYTNHVMGTSRRYKKQLLDYPAKLWGYKTCHGNIMGM